MRAVEFSGVYKSFGSREALLDITLGIPTGCTTAIVGASGSGKSTFLQLINAVYQPDSGSIRIFGHPQPDTGLARFRRRIGYAVQGAALFPHLSAYENISLLAKLEGWTPGQIESRVLVLLAAMGLGSDLLQMYPGQLSGGQQQRVGLCRALMLKPELMLLDEPFSALDPITRFDLHKHFLASKEVGVTTTILVTHDIKEAIKLASYLVILGSGKILQAGKVDFVLAFPANDYVKKLLTSGS